MLSQRHGTVLACSLYVLKQALQPAVLVTSAEHCLIKLLLGAGVFAAAAGR